MERQAELKQFREKVTSNICSFFEDVKDIKLCVYESLSDMSTRADLKGWIHGSEIEDTASLRKELELLRAENASLKEVYEESSKAEPNLNGEQPTFESTYALLKSIQVSIPLSLRRESDDKTSNLFDVSYKYLNLLSNGATNQIGASDKIKFLYFNILSKLQIHGLALTEIIPGVRYRRMSLNEEGRKFFAEYERRFHAGTLPPVSS